MYAISPMHLQTFVLTVLDLSIWHCTYAKCWRLCRLEVDFHFSESTCFSVIPRLTRTQEGLLTIVIAVVAYWFISNYPSTVSWLSKEERTFVQARLKADSDATNDEAFSWAEVLLASKDIKVWLYAFAFHTMSLPLYTLSLFLVSHPTLSKSESDFN